ncbi:hypothetical protein [Microbacterium sp. cx-55]|uniref:hypothetical protein n=1 Tax=Microbacterium sp. cx-55 TaxID=2875948 RepID=UPI001CBF2AA5|nr:hypothetical protein [Microbacterium sp. cx-55]MBZ4486283.1 hypothetical protein [Microbacterium sp. cx-55]
MGKTAILAIRIIGDATSAVASLDEVDGSAKSMQNTMDKASVGAGVALGALAATATMAGNAASELQQATGAVDSVFGAYAGKIHEYAEQAADAVGLSESAYSNMATVIGSQLKNMGLSIDDAGGQTQWLIGLGADLSAMYGGTTSDAVSALSSLLRGERDPIERYGVSMNQAAIDAEKAALGLEGLSGEADKNADLQATLSILTRQTADAQGTFAREADTAAGQQQRANAQWENALAILGEQLLPIMTEGAAMLADWAKWAGENSEVVTVLAAAIGGLSAGILVINGAMKAYAAIQALQTAAQWANNAAWLASPVTWIVLGVMAAIALVIAIVVLLIQNWDEVQRKAGDVWQNVLDWIARVRTGFEVVIRAIMSWWTGMVESWRRGIEGFIALIRNALDWLGKLASNAIPGWAKDLLGMGGQTFAARMVVEEPPMLSARMAFTADETMAGFAQPADSARTTAGLSAVSLEGLTSGDAPRGGDTYNVTVTFSGLVTDEEAVAKKIREVLEQSDKTNGRKVAATVGL